MVKDSDGLLSAQLVRFREDVVILRLAGEADVASAPVLNEEFEKISREGSSNVIVDASGVTFMDSTGLHALVEGKRIVHNNGTKIYLVPSPQVRRVLELVFPDRLFAARVDTLEHALAAIGQ